MKFLFICFVLYRNLFVTETLDCLIKYCNIYCKYRRYSIFNYFSQYVFNVDISIENFDTSHHNIFFNSFDFYRSFHLDKIDFF